MNIKKATLFVFVLLMCGCASSSIVMMGQVRTAINPSQVKLYASAPSVHYDVIGLVTARSTAGLSSDQQQMDYALEALKEKAASVGANGIIMTSEGEVGGGSGGVYTPTYGGGGFYSGSNGHNKEVTGTAIYVAPDTQATKN